MFLNILYSVNPKSMWDCEYLESYEGFIKRISGWYEEADYYDGIGRWLFFDMDGSVLWWTGNMICTDKSVSRNKSELQWCEWMR